MTIAFNADEALRMAERIESDAAAFYRKAAAGHARERDCSFLLRLAAMEDEHRKFFAALRQQLSDKEKELTAYDPYEEATLYLSAMADTHGGEGSPSVATTLTGSEPMEQILRLAIGLEEKSVLFYLGIKDMVPEALGKGRLDRIIQEEKSHIVLLSRELHAVRNG